MPDVLKWAHSLCGIQQCAHLIARIICQRRYRFGGYPGKEEANAHIDDKIDCDIHRIAHPHTEKAIVEEYLQWLKNQHLPHDEGKAFFSAKLRKFVAKQAIVAKAAMYADDNQACTKCIERNRVYEAWK